MLYQKFSETRNTSSQTYITKKLFVFSTHNLRRENLNSLILFWWLHISLVTLVWSEKYANFVENPFHDLIFSIMVIIREFALHWIRTKIKQQFYLHNLHHWNNWNQNFYPTLMMKYQLHKKTVRMKGMILLVTVRKVMFKIVSHIIYTFIYLFIFIYIYLFIYLYIYIYYQLLLLSWLNIFPSVQGCVVHTSSPDRASEYSAVLYPDRATLSIAWLSSPRYYTKQEVLSNCCLFGEFLPSRSGLKKPHCNFPNRQKLPVWWSGADCWDTQSTAVAWSRYMVKILF